MRYTFDGTCITFDQLKQMYLARVAPLHFENGLDAKQARLLIDAYSLLGNT